MFALFKAIPLGIFLTLLVALFIGSSGSTGGMLNVFSFTVEDFTIYWSWALFLGGTGLAYALMLIMSD